MPEAKVYTEEDVKEIKDSLNTNFRLTNIEKTCAEISKSVLKSIASENKDSIEIKTAIEHANNDRRKCEANLKQKMEDHSAEYYEAFVKKTDLKIYATLIMLTIAGTAAFQAWDARKHAEQSLHMSNQIILDKIEEITKRK